mgnify:CR=1
MAPHLRWHPKEKMSSIVEGCHFEGNVGIPRVGLSLPVQILLNFYDETLYKTTLLCPQSCHPPSLSLRAVVTRS